jgi:hypothetical protein
MHKIKPIAFWFSMAAVFFCMGCNKLNVDGFNYALKKKNDLTNLLPVTYGPNIFGIDTASFSIRTHMKIDGMVIGGVDKLPSGGIAFTYHRKASNNAWGKKLYVADKKCVLQNIYPIAESPLAPKVVDHLLMVGSSAFEAGGTFKFQLYDTRNFSLTKEYTLRDMVDAWQITAFDNHAYFGIDPNETSEQRENSYIVDLDCATHDTTLISFNTPFFFNAVLSPVRNDSIIYIFNVLNRNIGLYNMHSKSIDATLLTDTIDQIKTFDAVRLTHPYFYDGFLYGKFAKNDKSGKESCLLAKFDHKTLKLMSLTKIDTPEGYTDGAHQFYAGNYFIMQFEKKIVIIDITSARLVKTLIIEEKYFK